MKGHIWLFSNSFPPSCGAPSYVKNQAKRESFESLIFEINYRPYKDAKISDCKRNYM